MASGQCSRKERAGGVRKAQNEANWIRSLITCQQAVNADVFGLIDAKRTQFRVVGDGTSKGWPCQKLACTQA